MKISSIRRLLQTYLQRYEAEDLSEKVQLVLTALIQLVFIGAALFSFFRGAWTTLFVSLAAMASTLLPLFFARKNRVHIPIEFEFILAIFVYSTLFLGEVHGFYTKFWWWDTVLHTGSGVALGFIGFLILYSLHRNGRLNIQPGLLTMFAFTFALSLGALWEIFEFTMDAALGPRMQMGGIKDTMWDLIVDALGAAAVSISAYFYLRYQKRGTGVLNYYLTAYFRKNIK